MAPPRILIVEDEIIVARDLEAQLRALGYEVLGPAGRGEEAVELAERQRPDLVLMDIRLQGEMDGVAAAEAIRARARLPVVYLTAHADEPTVRRARVTEAYGYILKPFEERELRPVIEMALYKHQADEQRLRLEEQLLQAQKLESLGVLAGGIAHDFNNLLTGILGYTNLAGNQLPAGSPALPLLREAEKAAHRAADLVRQLLAYAGKGKFVAERLDLNAVVQEMAPLLRTIVSRKATLRTELAPALPPIEADPGQLRQVVLNLITNASEALEGQEGVVGLRTGVVRVEDPKADSAGASPEARPGEYVFFEVTDTGCGMAPGTAARVFDPFFTTKFSGRGLGLAAVLGILRGHRGLVRLTSAPGQGSRFQALFPRCEAPARPAEVSWLASPAMSDLLRGRARGSVLVVDDEDAIRSLAARIAQNAGFGVVTASDGAEGVEAFRRAKDTFQAVLMDLTMPGLNGLEAAREIYRVRGDVPVVLMSGYGEPQVMAQLAGVRFAGFLEKPFVADALLRALHQALAPGG